MVHLCTVVGALLRNDSEVLKRRLREERLLEVQAAAATTSEKVPAEQAEHWPSSASLPSTPLVEMFAAAEAELNPLPFGQVEVAIGKHPATEVVEE